MDDHCIRLFEEGRAQSIGSRCIRFGGIRSFGSGIRFRCCVLRGIADGFRLCGGIGGFCFGVGTLSAGDKRTEQETCRKN